GWRPPPGCGRNRQDACFASSSPRGGSSRVSRPHRRHGRTIELRMSLDDVVAELLSGPLDEFTNRRNARSKELKVAGQRELAADVATLKKPPGAVWDGNQLVRSNKA